MNSSRVNYDNFLFQLFHSLLCFLATFLTFALCYDKPYVLISLLPFSYTVLNSIYKYKMQRMNYTGGFIHKVALLVIFIRFVITPVSIAITGDFYHPNAYTSTNSINHAILLMIFELLCVYVIFYIAGIYYSKRLNIIIQNSIKMPSHFFILAVFVILGSLIILMQEPNLLVPNEFLILSKNYQKINLDIKFEGFFYTLANLVKPVLFIILFSFVKKKYDMHKGRVYIWISFLIIILNMGLYTGTKRWEIVFAGVIGIYLLKNTYERIPKSYFIGACLLIIISFISVSLLKFSWAIHKSENPVRDIIIEMIRSIQNYFSGPSVVANSIEMKKEFGRYIGFSTFINDFIGSIPIVSNYVDQTNRINVYFNLYHRMPNTSLIMPMLGIGYSYFPLFPPIFTVIIEWFVIKIDFILYAYKSIEYKYLYLYFGLYLTMCMGFNTQIIFGKLLIPFIPLHILFRINENLGFKEQINSNEKYLSHRDG